MLREHLDRDRAVQLFVVREIDDRHAAVAECSLDAIPPCSECLGQSFSSCLFLCWPLCLPLSCVAAGTQWMRETSSPTVEPRCSWYGLGTRPALIAAMVSCCSCCAMLSARQGSPASRARATS